MLYRVADPIAGIHHNPGGTPRSVQRQYRLDGHVHRGDIERFEHNLGHPFAIRFRVQGRLGQQHGMLFGSNTKFVVKRMVPNFFHVIPVGHDAVFDGIFQCQHATLRLRLFVFFIDCTREERVISRRGPFFETHPARPGPATILSCLRHLRRSLRRHRFHFGHGFYPQISRFCFEKRG